MAAGALYPAFAAGFVLWGAGGALASGALEALVHTELDHRGAADHYARIMGITRALGLALVAAPLARPRACTWGGWVLLGAGFAVHQMLAVVADARLQETITGRARATLTSLAGLGTEAAAIAIFAAYAGLSTALGHPAVFTLFVLPYGVIGVIMLAPRRRSRPHTPRTEPPPDASSPRDRARAGEPGRAPTGARAHAASRGRRETAAGPQAPRTGTRLRPGRAPAHQAHRAPPGGALLNEDAPH